MGARLITYRQAGPSCAPNLISTSIVARLPRAALGEQYCSLLNLLLEIKLQRRLAKWSKLKTTKP